MSTKITAVFDSPDSADLALMHLRQSSISFENVTQGEAERQNEGFTNYAFPLAAAMDYQNTAMALPTTGVFPLMPYDVVNDNDRTRESREDVVLEIEVPSEMADDAVRILISSHGRKVTKN